MSDGLRVCSLASGSNGNCTLVSTGTDTILIDAGISARAVLAGLRSLEIAASSVRAILVTHEHSDHVRGIPVLAGRLGVPVVANTATLARVCGPEPGLDVTPLPTGGEVAIGGMHICSFAISHDAAEPVGYSLAYGGRRLAYATDTGVVTANLQEHLLGADLAVIEANHDVERLLNGPYPRFLKERILGHSGHLSNVTAGELAVTLLRNHPETEIWLAHLSEKNNTPRLALTTVRQALKDAGFPSARVAVLPRGCPGPVWNTAGHPKQLTLFDL